MTEVMTDTAARAPTERQGHSGMLSSFVGRYWLAVTLFLMIAVFAWLRPQILDPANIVTILRTSALMAIMVLGLTWLIAAGKIDVSFMHVAALGNMTAAWLLAGGSGWTIAALAGIAVGAVAGLVNGFLVAVLRLPPLIVTIATGGICASAAAALGKGTSVRIADPGILGELLYVSWGPIPLIAIVVAVVYALSWYAQEKLTFGHYIFATAQSEAAVNEAGISSRRLLLFLFVFSGLCSAIAGVLLAANLSSGQPMIGNSYFIDGLTAVLLGGMMIRVGKPNVIGTTTAILLLSVLVSGSAMLGWADYQRQIIKGLLLLLGVAVAMRASRSPSAHATGA
ncbi:ribose transport system permease protein [Rhizobium sp. RU20A]|uniref:ABC transporter permease n=1 Tax=Rhizobium sp. RU20A TaxID=1907412 RepID=UPI0009553B0E|nr:ABC transporter permease [Rhizobium sp. RU20A]SIQ95986.1 ribose transport system permease protein [Rhizobium sp. RU20A]